MEVMIILISVSLLVATCFLVAFIWSVRTNQYEDTYTPSIRILLEDDYSGTKQTEEPDRDEE